MVLFHVSAKLIYALHGKIVFFDGTYVVGKVTKVDESTVYIIPIGLDTAEGVLVGNIDSLKMENGMVPVVNSAVKYFFQNGEFLENDDDWMDEYDDFRYDDYASLQNEYKYEGSKKTHQQYYQISAFVGQPVLTAVSLQEENGTFNMTPNLGLSFSMPYFAFGALDVSPGFKLMNYTFESSYQGNVQAIQLSTFASFDFKPVLFFIPEHIHLAADLGVTYNLGYDLDQNTDNYPNVETQNLTGSETYAGVGFNTGGSAEYWMPNIPIAFKLFFNVNIIPQAPPFMDKSSVFANLGLSFVIVLKRHRTNLE